MAFIAVVASIKSTGAGLPKYCKCMNKKLLVHHFAILTIRRPILGQISSGMRPNKWSLKLEVLSI